MSRQSVIVYFFRKYDVPTDRFLRSKRPALLSTIYRRGVQGDPLFETALEVDSSELDEEGFVRRTSSERA